MCRANKALTNMQTQTIDWLDVYFIRFLIGIFNLLFGITLIKQMKYNFYKYELKFFVISKFTYNIFIF